MARTRQEIVDSLLEKAAADPILGTVSRSLVGKELIYFGATVLHQLEQAGATLSSFADLARADAAQLIAYAYTHEVPCSFTKPAIVRLKATTNKVETFAPFTVMLTVGGTRFYNIDFVTTDREFTLYQGTPKAVTSVANKTLDAFGLDSLQIIRQYQNWKLYKEFSEGRYLSSYLKLGDNAIPESIRVFAQAMDGVDQGIVFPYTEYNQGLSAPAAKLYKVRTGWDHSINVFFGDDNWAEQVSQEQYNYEIYFLDSTITNFTVTANNVLSLGGRQLTQKPSADGESYAVSSYSMGEENSLNYAHTSILAAQFLSQGLITEEQILNYVTSLDSVNSAKLLTDNGTHSVDVVVKPAEPDNVEFGYLEDTLRQNGAIGVNYRVIVATAVDFSVTLSLVGSSSQNLVRAQQVIEEYCAYNNITLSSQISSATLNQVLQLAGIRDIIATIAVEHETVMQDTQGAQKLSAPPVVNTLKLYDSAGNLIGFDADGVFRRLDSSNTIGAKDTQYKVSKVGDFFFLAIATGANDTFFVDIQNGRLLATPANTMTDPNGNSVGRGVFFRSSDNGMVMFLNNNNNNILSFANSNSIHRGDTSIFNRRTEVRALTSYPVEMPTGVTLRSEYCPVLLNGYYYLVGSVITGGSTSYSFYRGRLVDDVIKITENLGIAVNGSNANSYFVYDGKFMCLNPGSGERYVSWWDAAGNGQYEFEVPQLSTANITLSVKDSTAYLVSRDTTKQELKVVMGSVQVYNNKGVDTLRIVSPMVYPFDSPKPEISDPVFTGNINVFPTEEQVDILNSTRLFPMLANGVPLPALDWWKAEQFVSEGSVDYNTGVVYGVYATDGAYFAFNVAGVLSGDTTYPRYVRR